MPAILKAPIRKLFLVFLLTILAAPLEIFSQGLKVSPNQRFLVKADGSPFFYIKPGQQRIYGNPGGGFGRN
jgi:hypothetical protein